MQTAIFKYLQNAFAIFGAQVFYTPVQSTPAHTKMLNAFARDVATFSRFKL